MLWTNKDEGEYEMKFSFTEQCTTKSVSFAKITYIKEKLPLRMKNVDYNMQFQMASVSKKNNYFTFYFYQFLIKVINYNCILKKKKYLLSDLHLV